MTVYYTGIGSRDISSHIVELLRQIGTTLAQAGYTLRSGGASGADTAFEEGCNSVEGKKEIYLPWSKFNGRDENNEGYYCTRNTHYEEYKLAKEIASQTHPAWDTLKDGAKMLHTRNCHQVLGLDLKTPSAFVVCYSEANVGKAPNFVRGTGQALRLAAAHKVATYNLADPDHCAAFREEVVKSLFLLRE